MSLSALVMFSQVLAVFAALKRSLPHIEKDLGPLWPQDRLAQCPHRKGDVTTGFVPSPQDCFSLGRPSLAFRPP